MIRIREFIKRNYNEIIVFLISFLGFSVIYYPFFTDFYTPDQVTYVVGGYVASKPDGLWYYFLGGRPMTWAYAWIEYLLGFCGITKLSNSCIFQVTQFVFLAGAVTVLYSVYDNALYGRRNPKISWPILVILMICFVNPMYMNIVVFKGSELAFAILLSALAVKMFINENYILSFVLLILAIFSYQNLFAPFLIWSTALLIILNKHRCSKSFLLKFLSVNVMAVLSIVVNLVSTKLVIFIKNKMIVAEAMEEATQLGEVVDISTLEHLEAIKPLGGAAGGILGLIKIALCAVKAVLRNVCYPSCLFQVLAVVSCIILIIIMLMRRERFAEIIVTAVALLAMNLYYIVIYLSGSADYSGRVMWPFFAGVSATLICLLYEIKRIGITHWGTIVIPWCMLGVVCVNMVIYTNDFFINQSLDRQMVGIIESEIDEYEKESNIKITTIAVNPNIETEYYSKYLRGKYVFNAYSFNSKTYGASWADVELINYLTGKRYIEKELSDQEYKQLFGDKKFEEFNASEQLVFDGDTLYWAKY